MPGPPRAGRRGDPVAGAPTIRRARFTRAFTLLELLVVLVIIGVVISMVSLSIGTHNRETVLSEQARRLAALIDMAGEQAIVSSEPFGVRFSPTGYRFLVLDGKKWRAVSNDDLLRPRRLAAGMRITLEISGEPVPLAAAGDDLKPHVFLYTTGERTPFTATLRIGTDGPAVRVTGPFSGKVRVAGADAEERR